MRTTLTVEDRLMTRLRRLAAKRGVPLKEVVNQALHAGLEAMSRPAPRKPYVARTFRMGKPRMVTPDKALRLADEMEDEEVQRKQALRK